MKITTLGCLGAYPYKGQGTTSFLIEAQGFHLLLDAGSTTLVQLEKVLDPLALDAVMITLLTWVSCNTIGSYILKRKNEKSYRFMDIAKIKRLLRS